MTAGPFFIPEEVSASYWAAGAQHVLTLLRCSQYTLPPDAIWPHFHCFDRKFTYEPVAGRGVIRTWTMVRQSFHAVFDVLS